MQRIHERDRRVERQADRQTPHDGMGRACIASRGKKMVHFCVFFSIINFEALAVQDRATLFARQMFIVKNLSKNV